MSSSSSIEQAARREMQKRVKFLEVSVDDVPHSDADNATVAAADNAAAASPTPRTLWWPCLVFDNSKTMEESLKAMGRLDQETKDEVNEALIRSMMLPGFRQRQPAFLLGRTIPTEDRVVYLSSDHFQDFDNLFVEVIERAEGTPYYQDLAVALGELLPKKNDKKKTGKPVPASASASAEEKKSDDATDSAISSAKQPPVETEKEDPAQKSSLEGNSMEIDTVAAAAKLSATSTASSSETAAKEASVAKTPSLNKSATSDAAPMDVETAKPAAVTTEKPGAAIAKTPSVDDSKATDNAPMDVESAKPAAVTAQKPDSGGSPAFPAPDTAGDDDDEAPGSPIDKSTNHSQGAAENKTVSAEEEPPVESEPAVLNASRRSTRSSSGGDAANEGSRSNKKQSSVPTKKATSHGKKNGANNKSSTEKQVGTPRPRGAAPKGKKWDPKRGAWVSDSTVLAAASGKPSATVSGPSAKRPNTTTKSSAANRKPKGKARASKQKGLSPSFSDVQKILEKGRYVFRSGLYCRPGMDPSKNKEAVLNEDYFEDKTTFRRHLCSHGIDACKKWSDDDEKLIQQWVQYAIVKSADLEVESPEYVPLASAWTKLESIGFRYKGGMIESVYTLPGVKSPKSKLVHDGEKVFKSTLGSEGLYVHLARFGLPDDCDFGAISKEELLGLELYLSEPSPDDFDRFERWQPETTPEGSQTTISRPRRSTCDAATVVTQESPVEAETAIATTKSKGKKNSKKRKVRDSQAVEEKANKRRTKASRLSKADSSDRRLTASSTLSSPPAPPPKAPSHLSPVSQSVSSSMRVFNGSDVDKLTGCIEALQASVEDENSYFAVPADTNLSSCLEQIRGFMLRILDSHDDFEAKNMEHLDPGVSSSMYVCGNPGTGKTSGIDYCCRLVAEHAQRDPESDAAKPLFCHINVAHLSKTPDPMEAVLKAMGKVARKARGSKDYGKEKVKEKSTESGVLSKIPKDKIMFVIVDEVDSIASTSTGRKVIASLARMAKTRSDRVALIGIANSANNETFHMFQTEGWFQEIVTFKAYREDDFVQIIQARIGNSIVDPKALQMIAKMAANHGGDVRGALGLAANAVHDAKTKLLASGNSNSSAKGRYLVSVKNAFAASKEGVTILSEIVAHQPQVAKVALCVLVTLAQAEVKATTLDKLQRFVWDCMSYTPEDAVSKQDFYLILENLRDSSLLRTQSNLSANLDAPISLDIQLEEVVKAVHDELGRLDYYQNLLERARKNRKKFGAYA